MQVIIFPSKSFFAYSFIIGIIFAFLFHASFIPIIINFASGFHKLNENVDFDFISNKFILYKVLKPLSITVHKSLLALYYLNKVLLKVSNVSDR